MILDDDAFTRTAVQSALRTHGLEVFPVSSVSELIAQMPQVKPAVALVDLDLGDGPTGVSAVYWIEQHMPHTGIVILSSHRSTALVEPYSELRASIPHVIKSELKSMSDLVDILRAAAAHQRVPNQRPVTNDTLVLSQSQAEVLRLLALGRSNQEIADERRTSVRAVQRIIQRLVERLGLDPTASSEAVRVQASRIYQSAKIDVR